MYGITAGVNVLGPSNLVTINLSTGVATVVGNTGLRAGGLQFGPDGSLYAGTADSGFLYRVDLQTGASTLIGSTGFDSVTGLTLTDLTAVPIPPGIFLLCSGLFCLAGFRRKLGQG